MNKKFIIFLIFFVSCWNLGVTVTAANVFTEEVNGVKMAFQILSVDEKTVQIGNGKETAIPTETSGALVIPSKVAIDGLTYNVVSIADSAFYASNKLTSVEFPSSIMSSGKDAFLGCDGLQKIIVSDIIAWCAVSFNNKPSNPLYYAKHFYSNADTEVKNLVIPEGVANIGSFAFIKGLFNTVTIPGSVAEVGSYSFYKCTSLTSLNTLKGTGRIRSYAFYGCTALTSVILSDGMTRLGGSAFYGCTALETIILPSSMTSVGNYTFKQCSSLRQVTSDVLSPSTMGTESFASIASDCKLYIPVGTLTTYHNAGWTKDVFTGGVVEIGDVEVNYCIENAVTADFIKNVVYPNDDYSYTKMSDYRNQKTQYRKDLPSPVRIEVPITDDGEALVLETYNHGLQVRSDTFLVGQRALEIWNLIPQTSYIYKLFLLGSDHMKSEISQGTFETEGQVRMLNIDGTCNVRDIGGWKLSNGQYVKYDRIFRSAELEKPDDTSRMITTAGIHELLETQGVDVEIDFGDYDGSPVSDRLEFFRGSDYQINLYADGLKKTGTKYKNCFEKTVNSLREGKKVLFHCTAGADRTGTFAFLLEGLLGVSESDLAKDYELTSFKYDKRYRNISKNTVENATYLDYKGLVEYVKTFPGNTLNEQIEQMALSIGISQEDIDDFRNLMTANDFIAEVNGVKMAFQILNVDEKTIQIGNGKETAIPVETSGTLMIPSKVIVDGITYNVVCIADSAFYACKNLTSVVVPPCIKSSGKDAFLGCSSLQKLIVSDLSAWCAISFSNKYSNPLYYAKHLFSDENTEITDLVIPDGVPNIEPYTFVKGLFYTISIPGSVSEVRSNSFYKCTSLTTIKLAKGVNKIRTNAFYGCIALSSVTMPEGMTRIGTSAFYQCTALETIELPSSISEIGNTAFKLCSNLRQVTASNLSPKAFGTESFASIADDCKLLVPVLTLPKYNSVGWTKEVFGGGIVEVGDVVENFCLENGVTSEFIKNVTYPNDDYSYTKITDYTTQATSYMKDRPMPVRIEVPLTNEGDSLILETYHEGLMARSDTFLIGQRALEIWNLIPQTSYTYKLYVLNSDKTKTEVLGGNFETTGQVRMMKIDNMRNFRDIGGWKLPNGEHVKYDKIFRSAELALKTQMITSAGIHELLQVQGIGVEIDFGDSSRVSPIEDYIEFVHGENYQITSYANGLKSKGLQYKKCFEEVVKYLREGKKILFHCNAGADRTGTFAFLLEGLLGVSESDLCKDYELTSFYSDRFRTNNDPYGRYKDLINYVKNTFEGETLNEKIEQMALNLGITQKDINDFRSLMYECNTLSAPNVSIAKGKAVQMPVYMSNMDDITAFQFYVEVPKGITLSEVVLGERKSSSHTAQYIKQAEGLYKVVSVSTGNEMFSGNDGKLVNLKLSANSDMNLGDYSVTIKDIVLTSQTGIKYYPSNVSAVLTVLDYLEGDADGDGIVDVADVVAMVNYILEKPTADFMFLAADMNGDGEIDIFDVMLAVNLVLNQSSPARSKVRAMGAGDTLEPMYMTATSDGIRLDIADAGRFTAFQFDVEVPEGTELKDAVLTGSEDTHLIRIAKTGENSYRVMAVSLNNTSLMATAQGLLKLSLSDNSRSVVIDNIKFVTPQGESVYFSASQKGSTTGIREIDAGQDEIIYDMSGRRVNTTRENLPKGIYIVNNTKVVIR